MSNRLSPRSNEENLTEPISHPIQYSCLLGNGCEIVDKLEGFKFTRIVENWFTIHEIHLSNLSGDRDSRLEATFHFNDSDERRYFLSNTEDFSFHIFIEGIDEIAFTVECCENTCPAPGFTKSTSSLYSASKNNAFETVTLEFQLPHDERKKFINILENLQSKGRFGTVFLHIEARIKVTVNVSFLKLKHSSPHEDSLSSEDHAVTYIQLVKRFCKIHVPVPKDKCFKIAIASDFHVSFRNDYFAGKYPKSDSNSVICNPNDQFRRFLKWSKSQVNNGDLHLVILAGDLIDYYLKDDSAIQGDRIDPSGYKSPSEFILSVKPDFFGSNWSVFTSILREMHSSENTPDKLSLPLEVLPGNHESLLFPLPVQNINGFTHYTDTFGLDNRIAVNWDTSRLKVKYKNITWNYDNNSFTRFLRFRKNKQLLKYLYFILNNQSSLSEEFLKSSCNFEDFKTIHVRFDHDYKNLPQSVKLILADSGNQFNEISNIDFDNLPDYHHELTNLSNPDCMGLSESATQEILKKFEGQKIIISHAGILSVDNTKLIPDQSGLSQVLVPPYSGYNGRFLNAGYGVALNNRTRIIDRLVQENGSVPIWISGHTHQSQTVLLHDVLNREIHWHAEPKSIHASVSNETLPIKKSKKSVSFTTPAGYLISMCDGSSCKLDISCLNNTEDHKQVKLMNISCGSIGYKEKGTEKNSFVVLTLMNGAVVNIESKSLDDT